MRGFAQHLYTLINFSDLRELVNFQCVTIGVGDCEANQSSWHEAFVLQECPLGGATLDALLCSLYNPLAHLSGPPVKCLATTGQHPSFLSQWKRR